MSTITSIPASQLVAVTPNVLTAGGSGLDLNGLLLSTAARVPIGTVQQFPDPDSVAKYFGASSIEKAYADRYFAGFTGGNKTPATLFFAQYPSAPVAPFLRGGPLSPTVAALQAIKPASITASIGGSVTASVGASFTATGSGVNLTVSAVTGLISNGDGITGTGVPTNTFIVSQFSGTPGAAGVYITNQACTSSGDSLTSTSTILDVTAEASGTLQPGDTVSGSGMTAATIASQVTGTPGSTGTYRLNGAQQHVASTTVTSLSTTLHATVIASGTIVAGLLLTGTNVTSGTRVGAQISGTTGGVGLYAVSLASTTISEAMTGAYDLSVTVDGSPAASSSIDLSAATSPSAAATTIGSAIGETVTYDSVTGAFVITGPVTGSAGTITYATGGLAGALLLTQALGAILSQGANAATPAAFMDSMVAASQQWVTFATTFDPDGGSGNANKDAFAVWNGLKNNRYAYVCQDSDVTATQSVPAASSLGQILENANVSGTILCWEPSEEYLTGFVMGAIASIDFEETNGRTTLAYRSQSGMTAGVTTASAAVNLGGNPQASGDRGNGYNFYGDYTLNGQPFVWFQRGFVTGVYKWADSYVNQIWLNAQFQLALLNFLANSKSVPYNDDGYGGIRAACMDPINAGLNFGAFRAGVPLSAAQAQEVNAAAGLKISDTLATQGWYLQIKPATAFVRANRTSPPITFWYMDGESVQSINLTSITVQ